MIAAFWLVLFRVLVAALTVISDETQAYAPDGSVKEAPLPPPLVLGPIARDAFAGLLHQAETELLWAVARQGGLFLARVGGRA